MNIRIGLVGVGMFGGDVPLRACADFQRAGISPQLGRLGLDLWARDFAPVRFELAALAARTEQSARKACEIFHQWTGRSPAVFHGQTPWIDMLQTGKLDVLAVATPDPLHAPVILAGLNAGAHVLTEKPMCLELTEADRILQLARARDRIVSVDMHKRYDPDHLRFVSEGRETIGEPLYGTAYLEEPIEVSTATFKWAAQSDPFSYVGSHWVDLILHYYHSPPVSLTAIGQKKRLAGLGIDAYDAVQVRVDFANGLSMNFLNNWITPPDFEGPVNQGHEIVGTKGKWESDQQDRGLRWWSEGRGSRTANTHFVRSLRRSDGSLAAVGYGIDSLVAGMAAICRFKFFGASRESLVGVYPSAEEARPVVAIIEAARQVRDLNFKYLAEGKAAAVSAHFGPHGFTILDPYQATSLKCA